MHGYCFDDPINLVDPTGMYTDVHYYEGDVVDHVGIDPGGNGAVGWYPKTNGDIFGGEGEFRDETRTPVKTVRIPTTQEQETNIRERLNMGKKSSSVRYQLGFGDCVDFVDDELEAEGIDTPSSWGVRSPRKYIDRLDEYYNKP